MENDYRTGRLMARVTSALGWLIAASGIIGLVGLLALRIGQQPNPDPLAANIWTAIVAYAVPVSLALIVQGVFLVAVGQALRAVMDTANHSKQLLDYVRRTTN
jgi:hypothetical protein